GVVALSRRSSGSAVAKRQGPPLLRQLGSHEGDRLPRRRRRAAAREGTAPAADDPRPRSAGSDGDGRLHSRRPRIGPRRGARPGRRGDPAVSLARRAAVDIHLRGLRAGAARSHEPGARRRHDAGRLRPGLRSLDTIAHLDPEMLVNDDGSEPAAEVSAGTTRTGVRFLRGEDGCAAGRNRLVRAASRDYVLLLDDDTLILNAEAVTTA